MQAPDLRRLAALTEAWFERHQRPLPWRDGYDPYHVWVSEVMLQQTRMEVVLPYFERFIERFPSVGALAAATDDEVLSAWSGLGYYRRARMLRDGARRVIEHFGGMPPKSVADLLSIPGIGRYTAGAIASIAWGVPAPIVDGNVARILARLFAIEHPRASPRLMRQAWLHATSLANACTDPRSFNQGLMELGALVCLPRNPLCSECPLRDDCRAVTSGRTDGLPLPAQKKNATALRIVLYLVADDGGRVLMRRESGPLMTAMYHLPHADNALFPAPLLRVSRLGLVGVFRHTVTTRKIEFELHRARVVDVVADREAAYEWVDLRELARVPHPSYVRKALRLARMHVPSSALPAKAPRSSRLAAC